MHKNFQKILKSSPHYFDAKFPCDSRRGLRFALSRKLEGLEPETWGIQYTVYYPYTVKNNMIFHFETRIVSLSDAPKPSTITCSFVKPLLLAL